MAGAYMNPPEERLAWDRDGSILAAITSVGNVVAHPLNIRQGVNGESESETNVSSSGSTIKYLAIVFPIPMDLKAIFVSATNTSQCNVQTSKNTTNGLDGSWDTQLTNTPISTTTKPSYRSDTSVKLLLPTSISAAVKGVRLDGSFFYLKAFHVYGYPASSATTDRLALWHPDTDNRLPAGWFDWGNTPRSSSADRSFRIKNLSSARTANDVDMYIEALTPGNPSVAGMHTLSDNGGNTFQGALTIPVLIPGQISGEMILRRTVPANALVSTWSARLAADIDHWS